MQLIKKVSHFLKSIIPLIVCGIFGIFILSWITGKTPPNIINNPEVLAVCIVAIPTMYLWNVDIKNKNISEDATKVETFINIKNYIEPKYEKLVKELKTQLNSESVANTKNKNQNNLNDQTYYIDEILNGIYNFTLYLLQVAKTFSDEKKYYDFDLGFIFKTLDKFYSNNKNTTDITRNHLISKIKENILLYFFQTYPIEEMEELSLRLNFLTEVETFRNISFHKIPNLNNVRLNGNPTFTFIECSIDVDNFGVFNQNEITVTCENCEFYSGSLLTKEIRLTEKEFKERYNIDIKN
ncbi:hypothetical protein [Streptococcus suis]|uniref:Uncharacterized protein n=2 Tax=Streptococcus suis TaxID=1307 RepID=A0A3R8MYU0_STRSU|nr:hypothetical protein [Streptococcus suis]MDG4501556.1 hypothetical protein [Streptococcus suis]NQM35414.1 hypothetical protein [Streptococcus suis]RRN48192.1 hypothetical protein EI219_11500 [Streptococcus suis]HEL1626088.1 hypothetical protein [Streptococcus suis]HEM2793995.1 hypothetical protein [Streptococcus suis]